MQLPHPESRIAGCCWLPRLVAKVRLHGAGQLPLSYRLAFGSRIGVDGYFLRHFGLQLPRVLIAVRQRPSNEDVAAWFLRQPGVTAEKIAAWNALAPRLGAPGQPGYRTLQSMKWFFYPKLIGRRPAGIFAAIVEDEGLAPVSKNGEPGSSASATR